MKNNFRSLDREGAEELLSKHKDYLLPIIAIIAAIFLLLTFIVPKALSFTSRISEVSAENEKLQKIKDTQRILESVDEGLIEEQLVIATKALPSGKAFEDVLSGITTAAALSGSQIDGYIFQDQGISGQQNTGQFPSLNFEVTIVGGMDQASDFVTQLYKTFPLSNVSAIVNSQTTTRISILYYYNAFPSVSVEDRTQLKNMSAKESAAFSEISQWNETNIDIPLIIEEDEDEEATDSGQSPF